MTDITPVPLPEEASWMRLQQESNLWYGRFCLYLQQGHSRYLMRAIHAEDVQCGRPLTRAAPGSWRDAAKKYRWKERAEAYDEHKRQEIFTTGNASAQVRITKLDNLAEKLYDKTVKMLDAMKPPKGGFNELMILRLNETLDALAKETGGRVQRKEVSGPSGTPLEVLLYLPEQEDDRILGGEILGEISEGEEEWE